MIGYLEGKIKHVQKNKILLFSGGIGFTVFVPENHRYTIGDSVEVFIHTHLRDDDLSLFGLPEAEQLDLFELLISVSGVGPKTALNIFASASRDNIIQAISQSNLNFFTSISGLGKKTAQKIILDLKSKISKGDIDMSALEGNSELVDALVSLGYQKTEIQTIFSKVDSNLPLKEQIKSSLKLLNK